MDGESEGRREVGKGIMRGEEGRRNEGRRRQESLVDYSIWSVRSFGLVSNRVKK